MFAPIAASRRRRSTAKTRERRRTKAKEKTKPQKKESADAQQRALLKSAVGRLAPQRKGVTDLYTIGVAGWADEDVFIKELDGTLASLTKVLPIEGRVDAAGQQRRHREDARRSRPATTSRRRCARSPQVMDKDEDVLVLFMTSHGNAHGLRPASCRGGAPIEFAPRELAEILDGAGIQNRVVIVSACYSGIFVPPLANDNTIVITAADAKNPSFGCAPGREWTYFGDAFFNRDAAAGHGLAQRVQRARIMISEWELTDALTPSNPQGHFGEALVEKLAPVFAAKSGAAR